MNPASARGQGTEINFCGLNRDKSLFPSGNPARSA